MLPCRTVLRAIFIAAIAQPALACGFIESASSAPTLREDAAACRFLIFGTMSNPPGSANSVLAVTRVLKSDPAVKGRASIELERKVPIADAKKPPQYLIFGDVTDGKLDCYRGDVVGPAVVDYVLGGMALVRKDRVEVMGYCADFLEHSDPVIASDAFAEFLKSSDADIRKAGRAMSPTRLRSWLRDGQVLPVRLRLYAFLLAQCGTQSDAVLLREILDRAVKSDARPQIDGILTAYTLLDPMAGWTYTLDLLKDSKQDFFLRYDALRAARYFHTSQPEALPEKDRLAAMSIALKQADLADVAIEYLRQWKCWKLTDEVLAVAEMKVIDGGRLKRALLRYAVQCPDRPNAR